MRAMVFLAGAAALLAGCNKDAEKQTAEGMVRAALAGQGTVQAINLSKQSDNNYAGTATLRTPDGRTVTLNCTARRTGPDSNANFSASCGQALDQALLDEIKGMMRQALERQGSTVVQLELTKQDEDHATGSGEIRDPAGQIVHLTCSATRQDNGRFNPQCDPVGDAQQAAAPAAGEQEAPAENAQ